MTSIPLPPKVTNITSPPSSVQVCYQETVVAEEITLPDKIKNATGPEIGSLLVIQIDIRYPDFIRFDISFFHSSKVRLVSR